MTDRSPEIQAMKESMSAHFAALVLALEKQSPGIKEDFIDTLEKAHYKAKDEEGPEVDNTLLKESIYWTLSLIRGR